MASHEPGLFESSFSRTRSLIHTSIRPRALLNRQSLHVFSHKNPEISRRPSRRSSQRSAQGVKLYASSPTAKTVKSPVKRRMTFHKSKASKRRPTILHAVPAATACATAPLSPLEQDMATLPNQEILSNIGRASPEPDGQSSTRAVTQNHAVHLRRRSNSTTALSPIKAGTEMKFFSSSTSLKGAIGTYKDGRIQWEHKDNSSECNIGIGSYSRASSSARSQRPKIQVVIPKEQRDRPLPTSPFFSHVGHHHMRSTSAELDTIHDVSPPSGSKKSHTRESAVSPLSAAHQPPQIQIHSSINAQLSKTSSESLKHPNSSDDSHGSDASSIYSKRSSMTSVEAATPAINQKPMNFHERAASAAFSIASPIAAGVFDSPSRVTPKSENPDDETGPRVVAPSRSQPRRYAPHPPIEEDAQFMPTCALRPLRASSNNLPRRTSTIRRSSHRSVRRRSLALNDKMGAINQAINRTSSRQVPSSIPSPTLSEAENDLEQHLTSFTDDDPFRWDELVQRKDSAIVSPIGAPQTDSPTIGSPDPPALPRKSSKRQTNHGPDGFRLSRVPNDHIVSQLKRNRSIKKGTPLTPLTISIPNSKRMTDDFVLSPIPIPPKAVKRTITPGVAENVILTILQSFDDLDDLFATAIVNRGFYRVFKRYELDLIKNTLRKMSPPAWEYREICYPGHDRLNEEELEMERPREEYTPSTYLQYYTRDYYIIGAIKSLIKDNCESFVRPEISVALVSEDLMESARVDDALWRIWTFCKIFGCGKGREEDIVAQMDWLKGGVLVHQQTCTYSIFSPEDMNGTLASAPECFAKGNEGGLTAEQLFDMMELWNCLGVLLQPFEGRTIQAREHGVYDNTDVRGGDIDGEEMMLDEWHYFLLTLGLSPVLDLAGPCCQSDASAFKLASQNGWMNWKPPIFGGTRRNFLKEAASRVYEDKIAITYAESSTKEVQRQLSKQRIQRHITELRRRKNSGEPLPEIRMSQDRPMSEWEGVMNNLTRPRPSTSNSHSNNLVSHIPTLRSGLAQELSISIPELPAARTPPPPPPSRPDSPPRRVVAQPLLPTPPPSSVPSTRDRSSIALSMPSIDEHPAFRRHETIPEMPPLEHHPAFRQHLRQMSDAQSATPSATGSNHSREGHPAFQQHPRQREFMSDDHSENSADRAISRIVEMGFTPEQARHALRMTDLGDGLRVDRAVELLLRDM